MKTVIVGCGRVGAADGRSARPGRPSRSSSSTGDARPSTSSSSFKGNAVRGDGTDEDMLRRAGVEGADLFLALTEGDNRNVMAAQLATEALGVAQVVAKVNDPLRAEAYAALGLATICRTDLMLDAIMGFTGWRRHHPRRPGGDRPPSGDHGRASRSTSPAVARPCRPPVTMRGAGRRAPAAAGRRDGRRTPASEHPGGLSHVRARRRRRQGRLLPVQGARPGRPRGVLLEKDKARAGRSPMRSARSSIAHDGCEGKYLGEAGANRADIVAAVTGDDEDNLVICQMAKHHFDVPRTIARVNNPKNEALFKHLGVDELISPTRMVLGSIEQDIPVHELLHLGTLGRVATSRSSRRRCRPVRRRSGARPAT